MRLAKNKRARSEEVVTWMVQYMIVTLQDNQFFFCAVFFFFLRVICGIT